MALQYIPGHPRRREYAVVYFGLEGKSYFPYDTYLLDSPPTVESLISLTKELVLTSKRIVVIIQGGHQLMPMVEILHQHFPGTIKGLIITEPTSWYSYLFAEGDTTPLELKSIPLCREEIELMVKHRLGFIRDCFFNHQNG